MNTSSTAIAVGVVATVLATAGCTTPEVPRIAAFDEPVTAQDAPPDAAMLDREFEETRYLGEAEDALVYAAKAATDEPWCILLVFPEWASQSGCVNDASFIQQGVFGSASGGGQSGKALMLPDNFTGEINEAEWRLVTPNLAVPASADQ